MFVHDGLNQHIHLHFLSVKQTVAETVGDWYFERESATRVDCPFPCNPTCYNKDLSAG